MTNRSKTSGEASPGVIIALAVLGLIVLIGGVFALRVALAPAIGKGTVSDLSARK